MAAKDKSEKVVQSLVDRIITMEDEIEKKELSKKRVFETVSEEDCLTLIQQQKNRNTAKKTKYDLAIFETWLKEEKKENRKVEEVTNQELDKLIASFILAIRQSNGSEYEPDSLQSKFNSIGRYLREKNGTNINGDDTFRHSRDVLSAKKKSLKAQGKGNKKKKADPFSPDDILKLREQNLLGSSNPQALINSMWLNTTMHFGLRGCQEHTHMLWGDIELKVQTGGIEYLEFTERATKTRDGRSGEIRKFPPKMFQCKDNPELCPVFLYKEYRKRRPTEALEDTSRFYVQSVRKIKSSIWFTNNAAGKNTICSLAKTMAEQGELSARITNHSGRRTTIQTLLHSGTPPTEVMQLTGHKRIESLNYYNEASNEQQLNMSHKLTEFITKPSPAQRSASAVTNQHLTPAPSVADIPQLAPMLSVGAAQQLAPMACVGAAQQLAPMLSVGAAQQLAPMPSVGAAQQLAPISPESIAQQHGTLAPAFTGDQPLPMDLMEIDDTSLLSVVETLESTDQKDIRLEVQSNKIAKSVTSSSMGFLNNVIFNAPVTINFNSNNPGQF